jgi:hypothetical protein
LRPAIVASQLECVSRRRIKASLASFDFFAQKLTTTQRLRGARARTTDHAWWLSALERVGAETRSLRLLLIESLLCLCPTETIERCEASLSAILDSMVEEEWSILVQTLSSVRIAVGKPARDEALKKFGFKFESMRFSYLVASKGPKGLARLVFQRFFRTYAGATADYLEFKQEQAIRCAIAGEIQWDEALSIVRDGYARGVYVPRLEFDFRNSVIMPAEVYPQILSNSQLYPLSICDVAEAAASRAARKAVKPVSAIAKADRWFVFNQ